MAQATAPVSAPIPFVDLATPHAELAGEILAAWEKILRQAAFIGGPELSAFEAEFAQHTGTARAVGVSSGTDAIRFALLALGLRPGDEVITVPHTFIATTEAITQAGGKTVFVDVDRRTGTLDPAKLEAAIGPRTRVVIPVHLYGQTADMDPIMEITRRRNVAVIEDACQSHGARYNGRRAGTMGAAAAFSFYPGKNLGACGEAGAVTTDDPALADAIARLRDHGQSEKYHHAVEGYNGRLDAIQAAALRIKLRRLDDWNAARRRHATIYARLLADCGVGIPEEVPGREHVWHLYVIRHPDRERVRTALTEKGIGTGLHYPVPLHLQAAYASMGLTRGAFPESEAWAFEGLSLPMFPGLRDDQIERVCSAVRDCLR